MLVVQKKVETGWQAWAICGSFADVMSTFRVMRKLGYVARLRQGIEVL